MDSRFEYIEIEWEDPQSFKHEWEDFTDIEMMRSIARLGGLASAGTLGYKHTDETKALLSKQKTGVKRSIESCLKQSESVSGNKNHFFGKKHNEESRKKMSEAKIGLYDGANNPKAKAIKYKNKVYGTMKDMNKATGISLYHIRKMVQSGQVEVL